MAKILSIKYQFYKNNSYGGFVAGDVIEVYYDPDSDPGSSLYDGLGFSVYKNGIQILSGNTLDLSTSIVGITKYKPLICKSTLKVEPYPHAEFPYGSKNYFPDNPSCAIVTPIVCDLSFSGVPQVVNSSASDAADGSISIVATSSRSVQYKLNSDFQYDDGTANTTGIFSSLLPGDYRVYARDSVNCSSNVVVTVGIEEIIFGEYYRLEYEDVVGHQTRISIFKSGFAGSVTEVKGYFEPFELSLRGEGEEDKYIPVLSSQAVLSMVSETDFQFGSIYSNSKKDFTLEYYKNFGSGENLIWKGFILPQQYEEDYKAPPYAVQVTATDGLADLDKIAFVKDDGQLFFGTISVIKLIAFILKKTDLNLPIRVGINMYATGMDSSDDDDPLDQAYIDFDAIYIAQKSPTFLFALKEIIRPFGARLVQFDGYWNIIRIEELTGDIDYREFDSEGEYISNGTLSLLLDLIDPENGSTLLWSDKDQNMELRPGYGTVRVQYKLGLTDNILRNGDFRLKSTYNSTLHKYEWLIDTFGFQLVHNSGEVVFEGYESLQDGNVAYKLFGDRYRDNNGETYLVSTPYSFRMGSTNTLKIILRYKVPTVFTVLGQVLNIPYIKVRFVVKYGDLYLRNDGTWSDSYNLINIYVEKFDEYQQTEIIAQQPNSDYATTENEFTVTVFKAFYKHAEYASISDLENAPTVNIESYANFASFPTIGEGGVTYIDNSSSQEYEWDGDSYNNLGGGLRPGLEDGTRTEAFNGTYNNYYQIETTTDSPGSDLVRPDDYHSTKNPRQWRKVYQVATGIEYFSNNTPFWIDKIQVQFLDNGDAPIDTIIHERPSEPDNTEVLVKDLFFGSYSEVIKTGTIYVVPNGLYIGPGLNIPIPDPRVISTGNPQEITQSILSAKLIYRGYFREADGTGYETWTRDGISEQASLHSILASNLIAQYSRPTRRITGSIHGSSFLGFLNVINVVREDRLYLPISLTIKDQGRRYTGEFFELIRTIAGDGDPGGGSDGSTTSPFTNGFSSGFGTGNG